MEERDDELREILAEARTIAVVGIKQDPAEDAYQVPEYMQAAGYRIVPVNPKLREALGERAFDRVDQASEPVDIVNLFRAPENIPAHVDEILAMIPPPSAVWMQLGIHHGAAAAQLRAAGIRVVQDRCIMVDHRRLLSEPSPVRAGEPGAG